MGLDQIPGNDHLELRHLFGGWYPGKNHNDIPGVLGQGGAIGFSGCDSVVYFEGGLKKIFGWNNVNTSALNGGASTNSIFYSEVLQELVGNAGDTIFTGLNTAVPTDITDAIVISSTAQIDWTEFQFQATKLAIGVDGVNPPFKWDGATIAVLGGSPPTGSLITTWQNAVWIVDDEIVHFSDLVDPDNWDTNLTTGQNYAFDADIKAIHPFGRQMVLFFESHIGVMAGPDNFTLIKQDRFIDGVGTIAHNSVKPGKYKGQDVLIFHANDGIYAYNGTQNLIKLSEPISQKYKGEASTQRWNSSRFDKVVSIYDYRYNWYMMGISDGAATENDTLLISDFKRPYDIIEGPTVPHWPLLTLDQAIVSIEFSMLDDNLGDVYIGSDDGFVYKMDPALFNRDGAAYDSFGKTKVFDVINNHIVLETNVLSDEAGESLLNVYINASLQEGDGNLGTGNFVDGADVLDTSFVLHLSQLGGRDFILRNIEVGNFGRYLQFKFENNVLDQKMNVIALDLNLQNTGLDPNVGN